MVTSPSSQAFCLKLNSHQTHLIEAFQKLYNDEVMVDCTLSCHGGTLKAHKLVLSACSPYFTNLFSTFTNPYQYPVVILKDMPFSDLKAIIEFMYRGEVTVPQSSLPSVLDSAKTLVVTGLCDIKIANIETPAKNEGSGNAKASVGRRSRKRRRQGIDKIGVESQEGDSAAGDSEHSDLDASEGEISEKQIREAEDPNASGGDITLDDADDLMHTDSEQTDQGLVSSDNLDLSSLNSSQPGPSGVGHNLRSGQKLTPSAAMKANLRQMRIEKLQAITGGLSGRKMWSEDETRALVRVWEEESARVWASAGKKVLSLKRISDLLQAENIDRDVSQVEGKIKALKRDYKAVKADRAIPAVQARMAPYLDKLDAVFSRDEM